MLPLFCSESTCVTAAGETRALGFTTPRWRRQQEHLQDPSGHVVMWQSGSKAQAPAAPTAPDALLKAMASHCCRDSTKPCSQGLILPDFTGCALLNHPGWLCPQSLPHPRRCSTYPPSAARRAPFSQAEGQFHTIAQTSN